ncbi:hypothetical protein ACWN8V_10065 [Vagococcus elongatus]|uniref:DUF2187 domain-containing protein n=1 Tax=Vagococcus elongatus TaxID=180344 RepID=A0A430AQW0_9ENTE|nr:hypothetical protein [Vagococcus elongatus]RSU10297.1 hypothetical protein CBF29_09800 [Vagococcus elongatus]
MFYTSNKDISQNGKEFLPDTKVRFSIQNEIETGTVIKQKVNSAIIEIEETVNNRDLIFQTQGMVVISYKDLTIIN